MDYTKLFINGNYVPSVADKWIEVENPANGEIIASVPQADADDVKLASKVAQQAFEHYSQTTIEQRLNWVSRFRIYLHDHAEDIAATLSLELGCPLAFAREVHVEESLRSIDAFLLAAEQYPFEEKMEHSLIVREPVGVVGCITPWNYPLGQIIQKVIPALLCGNTVILKPSQKTPLTAYYVVDGFQAAGLPAGVLNLVTGEGSEVGDAMATDKDIDMISFTGSTLAGQEVSEVATEQLKRLTMELGGKSPALFLDAEYLAIGVKKTLDSVILNSGQTCSALSRAIVLEELRPAFEAEVKQQFAHYTVGDPQTAVSTGPLISDKQLKKVSTFIQQGKEKFPVLVEARGHLPFEGYYVQPIVFHEVDPDSSLAQEEIFGPVLSVIYVKDEKEAIRVANNSRYGLSGAIFSEPKRALRLARLLRTGSITINDSPGDVGSPFGGYKRSGFGREGGRYGIDEYVELKTIEI